MKKIICLISAVAMLTLAACTEQKMPEVSEVVDATSNLYSTVELIEITEEKMDVYFDGLDMDKVESYYAAKATDGFTDHFAVIKVKDKSYAAEVEKILSDYKTKLADTYESYAPLEAERARNGKVFIENDYYVIMVIADDPTLANEEISRCFTE